MVRTLSWCVPAIYTAAVARYLLHGTKRNNAFRTNQQGGSIDLGRSQGYQKANLNRKQRWLDQSSIIEIKANVYI